MLRKTLVLVAMLGFLSPWGSGPVLQAQDRTETIRHTKEFDVGPGGLLEVRNKYGKIQLQTWDRDEVSFDVEIKLTESSSSKLRKLKEDISIDFSSTNMMVLAHTKIESESGRIASEIKSIGSTISGSNKKVEINYTIKLPAYMDVHLDNKFGDIYMDDVEGTVEVTLSNGVLKANRLTGHTKLDLAFANAMVRTLGMAEVKLAYSDLSMDNGQQLDLESKSSRLNADTISILNLVSRRDKLYIKKVEHLYGNTNFSQVWIYDFLQLCDLYMKYGKLTMENIHTDFESIQIESDNADLLLFLAGGTSFSFDILRAEKSNLRLPEGTVSDESRSSNDYIKVTGSKGDGEQKGKFHIDAHQKSFVQIAYK